MLIEERVEGSYQRLVGGGHGETLVKVFKFAVVSSGDLSYSMVIIANKTVVYT